MYFSYGLRRIPITRSLYLIRHCGDALREADEKLLLFLRKRCDCRAHVLDALLFGFCHLDHLALLIVKPLYVFYGHLSIHILLIY